MEEHIWKSSSLGLSIKLQLYTAVVVSAVIYASETWKNTRRIQRKLDVFQQRFYERSWELPGTTR